MHETRTTTLAPAPRHRRLLLALALGALLAASMLALAEAEAPIDDPGAEAPPAAAATRWLHERAPHAWPGTRGPEFREQVAERLEARMPRVAGRWAGQVSRGGVARDGADAFGHWLAAAPAARPVVPGLVGPVPDGTEVRVSVYDGHPDDGGNLLVSLVYLAGSDDLAAFHRELREAAAEATHLVIDLLGRTVALPAPPADASD